MRGDEATKQHADRTALLATSRRVPAQAATDQSEATEEEGGGRERQAQKAS